MSLEKATKKGRLLSIDNSQRFACSFELSGPASGDLVEAGMECAEIHGFSRGTLTNPSHCQHRIAEMIRMCKLRVLD